MICYVYKIISMLFEKRWVCKKGFWKFVENREFIIIEKSNLFEFKDFDYG